MLSVIRRGKSTPGIASSENVTEGHLEKMVRPQILSRKRLADLCGSELWQEDSWGIAVKAGGGYVLADMLCQFRVREA